MEEGLSAASRSAAEELYVEFLRRRDDGDGIAFEAFCARHSARESELRRLHAEHELASQACRELRSAHWAEGGAGDTGGGEIGGAWKSLVEKLGAKAPADSRYRLLEEVAHGGMGTILRVWDTELDRSLAMKVIRGARSADPGDPGDLVSDPITLGRFLEEAQVTGRLEHPGIVPVHELGVVSGGRVFFTMRLVQGQSLREVIEQVERGEGGWSRERALHVVLKVCETVAYAHSRGVVHRDLKPSNVMVGRFGEVYTLDWGLAKVLERSEEGPAEAAGAAGDEVGSGPSLEAAGTRTGAVLGTPAYMAPEQAAGASGSVDHRADVYALGSILYHLLTGEMPYGRGNRSARETLRLLAAGPPRPVHELSPAVPAELEAICDKAMAREPDGRYRDAAELAEDLRAWLEGRVVRAWRTGALAELRKWVLRNRATAAAIAGALLVTVALLGALLFTTKIANVKISAAERRASHNLRKYERLSDRGVLDHLQDRARELWPARPERVAELEEWLADARELVAALPLHRANLAEVEELRAQSGPALTDPVSRSREGWMPELLAELVEGLKRLADPDPAVGLLADVEQRLQRARSIEGESIGAHRDAWDEATLEIFLSGLYDGLEMAPQIGLAPLGPDPETGLWEFWQVETGERPARDSDDRLAIGPESGLVLVLLPAGTFVMGAQRERPADAHYDPHVRFRLTPHSVTLEPFFLSKFEMTQGQWQRVSGRNPSHFTSSGPFAAGGREACPVEQASWDDCREVLRRVGLQLPTEAQWEYAARGGQESVWWCGEAPESVPEARAGNLFDRYLAGHGADPLWGPSEPWDDGRGEPAPVGSYAANDFGLHDVIGNVFEWCLDARADYDQAVRAGDGLRRAAQGGAAEQCVYRGGSFDSKAEAARSAFRDFNTRDTRSFNLGVRPARRLDPGSQR